MSLYEQLVAAGGERIDWGALGSVSFGVLLASYFGGLADLIATLWSELIVGPIQGVTYEVTSLINLVFGTFGWELQTSWFQLLAFIEQFGILAWLLALAFVLGIAYLLMQEVRLLG